MWFVMNKWMGSIDELMVIERWFGTPDPEELITRYDGALEALETGEMDTWLDHSRRAGITRLSSSHFKDHWMGGVVMPGVDPDRIATRLRSGFSAALADARDAVLPTNIVCVMLSDDEDAFDVGHVVGPNGVTVVISMPRSTVEGIAAE
jgi:hypothetical protein